MKKNLLLFGILLFLTISVLVLSCKESDPIDSVISPTEPMTSDNIEKYLSNVATNWSMGREDIAKHMNGYSIMVEDSDMLQYHMDKNSHIISYSLNNGKLSGSAILLPPMSDKTDFATLLHDYKYIGEYSGGIVYGNSAENTMAVLWNPVDDDSTYSAIGFAPIKSKRSTSITVTTGKVENIGYSSAIVYGTISGVKEYDEAGFVYGPNKNLTEYNGQKVLTSLTPNSPNEISLKLTCNYDETTFYYRAFVLYEGNYYYGDIKSFKTLPYTYTINNRTFNMILVDGGEMPPFKISQTELPLLEVGMDENRNKKVEFEEYRAWWRRIRNETGLQFRVPTYEEFIYAANGGKKSQGYKYPGSNSISDVAWYKGNSGGKPHEVAMKLPNELGLYDMSGNYSEACDNNAETSWAGWGNGVGGNWEEPASNCFPNSEATNVSFSNKGDWNNRIDPNVWAIRLVLPVYYEK